MRTITLLLMLIATVGLQAQQTYNLIVFTEDGSRFTLFLNSIQQHEAPEANVLVSGLNTPIYKAKVVFEDASKGTLEKTVYLPEQSSEVTFRIIEKKGKYKMRGFSVVPLPDVFEPAPNQRSVVVVTEPVYTQTTSTTVVQETGDNISMDVNVNGVGMSVDVNINDNTDAVIYEETTTVTTTGDHYVMAGYGGPIGCPWPMDEADFYEAKRTIAAKDWDETRLSLAKQIVAANCLFADQVRDLAGLMEWEETKLTFAKFAYDYTYDTGNYFKVSQVFEWEASVEELNAYISRR